MIDSYRWLKFVYILSSSVPHLTAGLCVTGCHEELGSYYIFVVVLLRFGMAFTKFYVVAICIQAIDKKLKTLGLGLRSMLGQWGVSFTMSFDIFYVVAICI